MRLPFFATLKKQKSDFAATILSLGFVVEERSGPHDGVERRQGPGGKGRSHGKADAVRDFHQVVHISHHHILRITVRGRQQDLHRFLSSQEAAARPSVCVCACGQKVL